MSIQSTGRMAMVFPFAFFLLLVGCSDPLPRQTPSETRQIRDEENKQAPTTTPAMKAAPLPGCQVERLEDAEQAVRQVLELPSGPSSHTPPLVYKIDGDLATCKLEVFCKPDEESEETLVWSVTSDSVVSVARTNAEAVGIIDPHYHYVLAIVVPKGSPKPDDQFVFSFSIQCTSRGKDVGRRFRRTHWDAKKAEDIFPDSFFVFSLPGSAGGRGRPTQPCHVKPGEERLLVEWTHEMVDESEAEKERFKTTDLVRYRITATCLEDGELPPTSDQEGDEEEAK